MDTDLRATSIRQSNQTSTDSDSVVRGIDSQGRAKAPTFHIQTGVRAGARGDVRTFIREEAEIR
jgi:hypothetical protein